MIKMHEVLKFCLENGILLDREIYGILSDFDEDTTKKIIKKISNLKEKIITKSFFDKNLGLFKDALKDEKVTEKLKLNFGLSFEISREPVFRDEPTEKQDTEKQENESGAQKLNNIKVIHSHINARKKLKVEDFVKYFRARYSEMKKFLQERKALEKAVSINKINSQKESISIICVVFSKRISKNKNIMLEVEDLTGLMKVLINKNKPEVYEKAKEILVDDIIGISGFGNRELIFANDIVYSDPFLAEKNKLDREELAAFISDIHVGSTNFLEGKFLKFIDWINCQIGDEKQRAEAKRVKYLFITGDAVEGVGIFPQQEELLKIKDVREQYNMLVSYLLKIRKDVTIIICPGQHDAVRIAEPQPPIGKDFAGSLHELENVLLVSNPALIEIGNGGKRGMKILMYHGASMNSYVDEIERLRIEKSHNNPSKVVREMLKRRHLSSIHSAVTYLPCEGSDPLLISEIPDIINTADFHRAEIDMYHNILIICSSCWQSITPFEEKVGNNPEPCKVPILNLKTREIKILDFSGEEENREEKCEEKEERMVCGVGK